MTCLIDADVMLYSYAHVAEISDNLYILKQNLIQSFRNILKDNDSENYYAFLTGKNNFRRQIAVTKPYKGTRKKPPLKCIEEIRNFMIKDLDCITVDGIEADDAISIFSRAIPNSVICATDKDFNQLEGLHYNLKTKLITNISKEEADFNLWVQVISGDPTDNIQGLKHGIGVKTALKFLYKSENYHADTLSLYIKTHGEYEGVLKFYENYRLIKLLESLEGFSPEIIESSKLKDHDSTIM